MKRQFLLPEKAEQSEDGKKEFPEKHDFPKVIEVEKLADARQSLKCFFKKLCLTKIHFIIAPMMCRSINQKGFFNFLSKLFYFQK